MAPHLAFVPYTSVKQYRGTTGYIDRAYGTRYFAAMFCASGACVPDFLAFSSIRVHYHIMVRTVRLFVPVILEARCAFCDCRNLC